MGRGVETSQREEHEMVMIEQASALCADLTHVECCKILAPVFDHDSTRPTDWRDYYETGELRDFVQGQEFPYAE